GGRVGFERSARGGAADGAACAEQRRRDDSRRHDGPDAWQNQARERGADFESAGESDARANNSADRPPQTPFFRGPRRPRVYAFGIARRDQMHGLHARAAQLFSGPGGKSEGLKDTRDSRHGTCWCKRASNVTGLTDTSTLPARSTAQEPAASRMRSVEGEPVSCMYLKANCPQLFMAPCAMAAAQTFWVRSQSHPMTRPTPIVPIGTTIASFHGGTPAMKTCDSRSD